MPAKGSKRGRKTRSGSHPTASTPAVKVVPQPAPHKPVDYSKFDNLTDSDEDESTDTAFTPSQLGLPEWDQTRTESCDCENCRAKAEAAERAASSMAKSQSSSRASIPQTPGSPGNFDWGKALGASAKAKIAEGKATRTHGLDDNTYRFGAESGHHGSHSATNGNSFLANGHASTGRQSSQGMSSSSNGNTDLALSPTRASAARLALHEDFARTYLAKEGFSHNVICNVLDRLELFKNSGSGESPDEACVRIFSELRIPFDRHAMSKYIANPPDQSSKGKKKQGSPKLPPRGPSNSRSKHATKPDPDAFKAALAKHGFTGSLTPLTPAAHNYMQTGSWYDTPDDDGYVDSDESPPPSDDDDLDDNDELLPLVDFPAPRFPSAKAAASTSYSSSRPPAAAPKQPVAKPAAAKASASSKASAAKASVTKPAPKVQVVDTVSDDDSEEDDMPSLVTSDESDQEQRQERPAKRTPPASRDPSEGRASPAVAAKGKQVPLDAAAKGKAIPSASAVKGKPVASAVLNSKPAPSAVPTEGEQSSVIAHGEPIFKPVSRGYLAEQSAKWASSQGQPTSDERKTSGSPLLKGASSSSEQKQTASGTDFSFDRAISGGSKGILKPAQPTAASSQLLGRHASSFVHYEYDSSGVTSEEELPPLEPESSQDSASAFEQATWLEAEERGRNPAASTLYANPPTYLETPEERLAKERAAEAAMQQLLEEVEQEKAQAAVKAEKAKKEKQKSKKGKQKAKKKAQQEAAAKRTGGKAGQAKPVGPSKNPQVPQSDSSDSDAEEEEEHSVLQQDSRFASLLSDITPAVGVEGSDKAVAGGPQPEQAGSLADGSAAGSYGPDSDNEVEAGHEDSLMMQYGGAFALLQNMGKGPSSEKSHSSQDTQSSSQAPAVPVLKPGESPLRWSNTNPQAQRSGSDGLAPPLGIRPGMQPGFQAPSGGVRPLQAAVRPLLPAGVRPLLPAGVRPQEQAGADPRQSPAGPHPDSQLSQVLEECRQALQEMEAASTGGERVRLQEAIRGGVTWLSHNGSNPDVATKSAEVRLKLRDPKARLKQIMSKPAAAQSRPSSSTSTASSAAELPHAPVGMPSGIPRSHMPLGFRIGQPPPPPRGAANEHLAQKSDSGELGQNPGQARPSAQVSEPRQTGRPYTLPLQPPASSAMPGFREPYSTGHNQPGGSMEPYRHSHGQQDTSHEPCRQPYLQLGAALEPFRGYNGPFQGRGGPAGGRGTGYQARPGARGAPYQQQGPWRGTHTGYQGAQQDDAFNAYRQRQGGHPRPPMQPPTAMPLPHQPAHSSQSGSGHGSDYGSGDRASLSGSEVASPTKSMQMRTHGQQTYVQPTPFEAPHQPSFYEEEDNECVVCMDSEATQFFNPCGHVLCCHTCAEKIMHNSKLCPVCNTAIAEFGFCSWLRSSEFKSALCGSTVLH